MQIQRDISFQADYIWHIIYITAMLRKTPHNAVFNFLLISLKIM